MHPRDLRNLLLLLVANLASITTACGDPPVESETPVDAGLDVGADGGTETPDSDAGSTGFEPDPSCGYFDTASGRYVFSCKGQWTVFYEMQSSQGEEDCPRWYRASDRAFETLQAGAAALGCDSTCVYVAHGAALLTYCGARGGVTIFVENGPGQTSPIGSCEDLYYYETVAGTGWYHSHEEFEAANPCP